MQKKESARRAATGEPEQIFRDDAHIMSYYFPEQHLKYRQPPASWKYYGWKDYVKAINRVRQENASNLPAKSGLSRKSNNYSINVIYFAKEDHEGTHENFEMLATHLNGDFRIIKGLEAVESFASVSND